MPAGEKTSHLYPKAETLPFGSVSAFPSIAQRLLFRNRLKSTPFSVLSLGCSQRVQKAQTKVFGSAFRGIYSSIIPRFNPIVTAWARSLASSFESMFAT